MKQIVILLNLLIMHTTSISQHWIDEDLYPFEHRYVQLTTGQMHYIDEGKGETILFIHGTPTWSFLYRNFIKELSGNFRCIAIDHLGFGLSEKVEKFDGTPQGHSKNLTEFIEKLNLENITLVVHDFGGPIGLGAAIENSEKIERIIAFNTWLWETKSEKSAQTIDKTLNSWVGKFLYLNLNFSPKILFKKAYHDKSKLTKNIHLHYTSPFPNKSSRVPLLKLGKSLVGSSDWYEIQWNALDCLQDKPWLFLWGMNDTFITSEYLDKWKNRLPHAEVVEFESGHFVQEESSREAIQELKSFLLEKN